MCGTVPLMASSDLASAYVVTLDVRGRIGAYLPRAGINVVAAADVARGSRSSAAGRASATCSAATTWPCATPSP